jgi:hypothetical protein
LILLMLFFKDDVALGVWLLGLIRDRASRGREGMHCTMVFCMLSTGPHAGGRASVAAAHGRPQSIAPEPLALTAKLGPQGKE